MVLERTAAEEKIETRGGRRRRGERKWRERGSEGFGSEEGEGDERGRIGRGGGGGDGQRGDLKERRETG